MSHIKCLFKRSCKVCNKCHNNILKHCQNLLFLISDPNNTKLFFIVYYLKEQTKKSVLIKNLENKPLVVVNSDMERIDFTNLDDLVKSPILMIGRGVQTKPR